MEQKYLSDDVIEKIKDFDHYKLTEQQNLLIDKLILDEELKECYKEYGLCEKCRQPNTSYSWCQSCYAKRFKQNFENWKSGNSNVDKLIQESQLNARNKKENLEWIEYDRFINIEYVAKGGFGTIYKAIWKDGSINYCDYKTHQWNGEKNMIVALKCLNNSKDITLEFLNEINLHLKMNNSDRIIQFYGITKNPKTNDFMMVMQYAQNGNLRQMLNRDFNSLGLKNKFDILIDIAKGLCDIHKVGLIHQDFHIGNILNYHIDVYDYTRITDLGLCRPANEKSEKHNKNVYGVLPYVAPEVLRGKNYTQESDIYGFGIIIYEVFNGLPPYYDIAHGEFLAIKICQGLRPRLNIKVPQLVEDIAKQCVDADPSKRPTAEYLSRTFNIWYWKSDVKDSEIYKQIIEAEKFNEKQPSFTKSLINTELTYTTHPQAIYTSRLLNFNNLPKPKNADDDEEFSDSTKFDFTKLNINPH